MKRIITASCFFLITALSYAQNGLENIIIEKYYIADANDAAADKTGNLKAGAVTYRIYADLLPGYRFQAAYGVDGHELKIATTTFFYNSEAGATKPNAIANAQLSKNTVMLDSWLSVGAACMGGFGIAKNDDDTTATIIAYATLVGEKNTNQTQAKLLQNENPLAGIPLKLRDGIKVASPQSVVTIFGIEKEINVFAYNKDASPAGLFSTSNGSWASFGGAIGPMPDNKVLIAQVTTDGELSFELNIQLGGPNRTVENYVAKNPTGKEILLPFLSFPTAE